MTTWVLLRGLAREARHWNGFGAALERASPRERVIALDLPGNGGLCRERSPLTVEGMVAAARAQLASSGHAPPYVPIALSLGGMVALQWACGHPRELAGCVLVNSSVAGLSPPWQRMRPGALATLLGALRPGLPPAHRERRIVELTTNLRGDVDALAARWAAYAHESPATRVNAARQLMAAMRFRAPATWPRVPGLVLASGADRVISPRCSQAIARRWGVPLRVHPRAGHDLPLDDPEWVIAQVLAWRAVLHAPSS